MASGAKKTWKPEFSRVLTMFPRLSNPSYLFTFTLSSAELMVSVLVSPKQSMAHTGGSVVIMSDS